MHYYSFFSTLSLAGDESCRDGECEKRSFRAWRAESTDFITDDYAEQSLFHHHYTSSILMEKDHAKTLGLSVHQERLRERINICCPKYDPALTAACTTPNSPLDATKENISPVVGSPGDRSRVNWIKYNILVSIYQNWLRLEPLIRYWLSKTYAACEQDVHRLCPFLQRGRKGGEPAESRKKVEELDILDEMRLRRDQLLKGLEPCEADIEQLCFARQLAKQLLSTLPLENNKWSKMRIEKQNRLLDEMINNFNEDQFQMNSEAIMHSIKERIYFIDEMQKKFIDISKEQKNKLEEKLELLKMPFKKVFSKNKARKIEPEALFESLWQEIESERSKLLTKKPQLRHTRQKVKNQRYAILQKSDSEGLVVKYQLKHGDYFNDSYVRSKFMKSRSRKLKTKPTKNESASIDETLQNSKLAEMTKDSVEELANDPSESNISNGNEKDQEEINAQFVEDFMRRQKLKPTYREQNSPFFKKTPTKYDNSYSHYRPSISYIDGRSNQDTDLSAAKSGKSISRERTSVFAQRPSRHRPSGEELTEKEDHMSRFRSHKKLITLKSIGGVSRHTKLKEQGKKDSQLGSLSRISEKLGKMQRKQFRKEPVDYRKGAFHKKGTQRREIITDEEISLVPENVLNLNRQEFLSYFNKILAAGHLDEQRYQPLKDKVKTLLKKHETTALQETHVYVQKLVQKSSEDQFRCMLGEDRSQILVDLCEVICHDERIRAKIREQMKIFFNETVEECCSEDSICNQQLLYNTTELRKVNQELKRIVCFRAEGESISFAKKLMKECNNLQQRSI